MRAPKSLADVEATARSYARELLNKARRGNTTMAERRCSVAEEVLGSECLELPMPRTNPSSAIQLLLQGLDFQRREKYEIAIQLFCKSILKNSNRQTFLCGHICRGNLFYELAHYHEAERDFVRCIQADSRCAVAHFNRGLALKCMAAKVRGNISLRQERLDGAMGEIETAAALAAKARDKDGAKTLEAILRVRALMLRRQGDFIRAQEDYLHVHMSMGREHTSAGAGGPSASGGARVSMVEELRDAALAAMAATETSRNDPSRLAPVCEYLKTVRFFAGLPPETLRACAVRCRCESVDTGSVMMQEGEDATAFLVLMEGTAEVKVATADEEVRIQKAAPGDVFGQRALIGGNAGKAIASVVVLSRPSAVFIVIDADAFVECGLEAHFRAIFERKLATLRQCVCFAALPEEELVELAHFTRFAIAERNTAIVEENGAPAFLCIVTRGFCRAEMILPAREEFGRSFAPTTPVLLASPDVRRISSKAASAHPKPMLATHLDALQALSPMRTLPSPKDITPRSGSGGTPRSPPTGSGSGSGSGSGGGLSLEIDAVAALGDTRPPVTRRPASFLDSMPVAHPTHAFQPLPYASSSSQSAEDRKLPLKSSLMPSKTPSRRRGPTTADFALPAIGSAGGALGAADSPGLWRESTRRAQKVVLKNLSPPQVFGECAVLDPLLGREQGSIVAVTLCELLIVHKKQIKTEWVTEECCAAMRTKCIEWPADSAVHNLCVPRARTAAGSTRRAHDTYSRACSLVLVAPPSPAFLATLHTVTSRRSSGKL